MDKQESSVILEARKEVQGHANVFLVTPILAIFDEVFDRSMAVDGRITTFQRALKEIPHWTTHIVAQCCDRIQKSCDFLPQLITALFLSHIKILSSIKITKISHIRVKVPKREKFLHAVLIETAKAMYEDPLVFRRKDHERKRGIVMHAIDTVVRRFLPLKDVLDAYLMNKASNVSETEEDCEMDTPIEQEDDEVNSVENLKHLIDEEETPVSSMLPDPPPKPVEATPVEPTSTATPASVTPAAPPVNEKVIHIESASTAKKSSRKRGDGMMFYRDPDVKDRAKI